MSLSVRESGIHTVSLPTIDPPVNTLWHGRHVAIAADSFLGDLGNFFSNVAQAIGTFFAHRVADLAMFGTAFGYMATTATTPADINRYIQELAVFANAVNRYVVNYRYANAGANDLPNEDTNLRNAFAAMSPDTRGLLYQVDARMVNRMIYSQMSQKNEYLEEIMRECNAAISLQHNLAFINDLFRCCSGDGSTSSASSPASAPSTTATSTGSATQPVTIAPPGPVSFPIVPEHVHGVIVNIPGTVAYEEHRIPPFVQQKADEIERLRDNFDQLPPASRPVVPDIFNDAFSGQDFMLIPIFDASHPDLQNALRAACMPGATAADAAVAPLNNRDLRHIYEAEGLIRAYLGPYGHGGAARCPACRHPDPRQVDRDHLRIDTELQDEILLFLRNAVGGP